MSSPKKNFFKPHLRSLGFTALSAALLILSFPRTDWWMLVWVGLVPLLLILDEKTPRQAFGTAYLAGLLFFSGTLYWFIHVTLLGVILIVLYLSLYFGIFGWVYARWAKSACAEKLILLPSVWVALEYIRAHLFSGFGWVSLGYSQYQNLWFSQIADITGVYGVSFVIIMVNVFTKELWIGYKKKKLNLSSMMSAGGFLVLGVLAIGLLYGAWRLSGVPSGQSLRVGVVQANIPQTMKWTQRAWPAIMQKHLFLTEQVLLERPDLVIWPETAFPGFLWQDPSRFESLKAYAAQKKTPLLLGSIAEDDDHYYNAALLLSAQAFPEQQYNKLHLVPFGEYIPFRGQMPFLTDIIPIDDFTSGKEYTVFSLGPKEQFKGRPRKFSVLICFEDGVSEIARHFVRKGAQFLVNITNDAWFMDTKAPFLHLQASVFRAIENRRTVIRCANTGVSSFIDPYGKITRSVSNGHKQTFVSGYAVGAVYVNTQGTVYTKLGDIFTYLCFGCILWKILVRKNKKS